MRPKGIMPPQNVSNNVQSTFNETNTDEKGYLAPTEFDESDDLEAAKRVENTSPSIDFRPADGEIIPVFATPFLRGHFNLPHDHIAVDCRRLVSKVKERAEHDLGRNYTTYFDEDVRTETHNLEWFKDFSDICKDTYISYIQNMLNIPVSHLSRNDIHLFAWVNVYTGEHHHETHNHTNCKMSGTYYVKAVEGSQPIKFTSPSIMALSGQQQVDRLVKRDGMNNIDFNGTNGTESEMNVYPNTGDFLLWPSYLQHAVPSIRDGIETGYERISISFNLWHKTDLDNNTTGRDMSYNFLQEDINHGK
jgi:uncharacterized protein (TIGR02466 family)|tara:strand:- start:3664 stop:4578 length:915 start_codon:yes stop_codon:yes gene_type:complete